MYTVSRPIQAMGFSPNTTYNVAKGSEIIGSFEYRPMDSEPYATYWHDPLSGQPFLVTANTHDGILKKVHMGFVARVESIAQYA